MGTINKPNLVLPLASSYNERGSDGFAHSITNSQDQRKVNCIYEISKNAVTGKTSFNLTKRPGVFSIGSSFGVSTQASYLITRVPLFNQTITELSPWVFSKDATNGADHRVSDGSTTKVIFSGSIQFIPCFIDHTAVSGTDTLVYQVQQNTLGIPQRVFFTGASASIAAAWTEITDGDFTSLIHVGKMEHMDGFAFIMDNKARIFNSDINSISAWNPANFATKQIKQDIPVGLIKHKDQILACGRFSFEAYYNAGNASGSPLSPIKQLQSNVGLSQIGENTTGSNYYAEVLGKTYFLGTASGAGTSSGVYAYDGSTATKISPAYIDKIIISAIGSFPPAPMTISKFGFHGRNAVSFLLSTRVSLSGAGTKKWLMYFPEWNDWFEWTSSVFSPINDAGMFLGCEPERAYIFKSQLQNDNWQDDGTSYQYMTQFKLPDSGPELKRMGMFGVNGDTSSAGAANTILVEFSDDDYQSFKTAGTISLSSDNKTIKRGGAYRNRAVRLSNTNAVETRLQSFIALVK